MNTDHPAARLAEAIAERLAHPASIPEWLSARPWWHHSLAHGAPGIALLHIERAAAGLSSWQRVHDWLAYTARSPVTSGPDSHLYYGAPAVAHALSCAAAQLPGAYARPLDILDRTIAADVRKRVDAAHRRIDAGRLPDLAEFDVIRGLAGVGAYLLRCDPIGEETLAILAYLVRLTEPIEADDGQLLPGWWTPSGPSGRVSGRFPGGHGNAGLSHGTAVI